MKKKTKRVESVFNNNNNNNSPSIIYQSLNWKIVKIWKLQVKIWSKKKNLIEKSRQRRSRNLPVTNTLPGLELAASPPPLSLLCVGARARLHARSHSGRQMACHPVLLCSLTCSLTTYCSAERHSPEKFLETSMVVRMAPCRSRKTRVTHPQSKFKSGIPATYDLETSAKWSLPLILPLIGLC